jgi:cytosine/adenosine deaminase-related metal-dependent hydrolase
VCIHSEYLTDAGFCRELAAANRELDRPLHVHVSETRREHEECIARHGKTPIAHLADTGILEHGAYAAHCVWATDDDFRIMRECGVTLVHNPSSNMKLGSGFARIAAAKALADMVSEEELSPDYILPSPLNRAVADAVANAVAAEARRAGIARF